MKREEQINQAAQRYTHDTGGLTKAIWELAFKAGAQWADKNRQIDVDTALNYDLGHAEGFKEAIIKLMDLIRKSKVTPDIPNGDIIKMVKKHKMEWKKK